MKFYYTPGTVSLAAHIALEMSTLSYQTQAIDFKQQEQKGASFLAVNPLGRVPALATPQGVITEVIAILNFIVARGIKPDSPLYLSTQQDDFFKAKVDAFNSFMSSTVHVGHAHLWRAERWVSEASSKKDMAEKTPLNMQNYYRLIEEQLFIEPWVHGEIFSTSDILLFVVTRWLSGDGVDPQQFSKVYQHFVKVSQISEVEQLVNGLHAG